MLNGVLAQAPAGTIGFDTTEPLTLVSAKQFYNKGYRFVVRYVPRDNTSRFTDITQSEAEAILDAGLALMVVQHPLAAGWVPTEQTGAAFGDAAAKYAGAAGLPANVTVWLDLEGVKAGTAAEDVIAYCNAWLAQVAAVGYATGIYIGADPGLSADQLYWDLRTTRYWKGGSSAKAGVPDDIPVRGYQLIQRINNPGPNEFDSNVTKTDNLGGSITWLAPGSPLIG